MMEGQKEEGGRKEEAGGGGRRRRTGRGTSIPPAPTHPPTHLPAHSSTPPRLQDRIRISATPFPIPAACFPFPHHLPLPRRLLSFSPSPAISRTTTVRAPTCARWRTRSCVAQTRHLADFALIVASGRKHGRGARPPFAFRDGARLGPHSAEHRDRRRVLSLPQRPAFQSGRLRGGHVLGAAVFAECPVAEGRPRGRQAVPIFQRAPEGAYARLGPRSAEHGDLASQLCRNFPRRPFTFHAITSLRLPATPPHSIPPRSIPSHPVPSLPRESSFFPPRPFPFRVSPFLRLPAAPPHPIPSRAMPSHMFQRTSHAMTSLRLPSTPPHSIPPRSIPSHPVPSLPRESSSFPPRKRRRAPERGVKGRTNSQSSNRGSSDGGSPGVALRMALRN